MLPKKIPVSFKDVEKEIELYNWINKQSEIIGKSHFIKQVLYEKMIKDEATKK